MNVLLQILGIKKQGDTCYKVSPCNARLHLIIQVYVIL